MLRIGLLGLLAVGNVAIPAISLVVRAVAPSSARPRGVAGINKLAIVDDCLWRGSAPSLDGYRSLAAAGVTTTIDLRAEADAGELDAEIEAIGIAVVHLPIRDGQSPSASNVARLLDLVEGRDGIVYVHCGAGVGRTGSMVAAYAVHRGLSTAARSAVRNLAIGPPSLEQLAFMVGLDGGVVRRPPVLIVVLSRVLDAPRRLWSVAVKQPLRRRRSARREEPADGDDPALVRERAGHHGARGLTPVHPRR